MKPRQGHCLAPSSHAPARQPSASRCSRSVRPSCAIPIACVWCWHRNIFSSTSSSAPPVPWPRNLCSVLSRHAKNQRGVRGNCVLRSLHCHLSTHKLQSIAYKATPVCFCAALRLSHELSGLGCDSLVSALACSCASNCSSRSELRINSKLVRSIFGFFGQLR